MSKALAGWYADAQRGTGERWFDGDHWTEQRRHVREPARSTSRRVVIVLAIAVALGTIAAGSIATLLG